MKLLGHQYIGNEELVEFLNVVKQYSSHSILVQVFSGIVDKSFLEPILKTIDSMLPKACIIGATSAGEILEGTIRTSSVNISISLFDTTEISTTYYSYQITYKSTDKVISQSQIHTPTLYRFV